MNLFNVLPIMDKIMEDDPESEGCVGACRGGCKACQGCAGCKNTAKVKVSNSIVTV